jgi:hypothetical protein
LGEATRRLCDDGFRRFLDFASGLPTVDHIHEVAPEGTKVIYSDADTVTVAYGQQIIGDNPNIRYVQCDAGQPEKLLHSDVVTELFGEDRKVAIGFNGIAFFLADDVLARSLKTIYDWADKGARMFFIDHDIPVQTDQCKAMVAFYKNLQPVHIRSKERVLEIIGPWTITEPGFMYLHEWIGIDSSATDEMVKEFGGGHVGAILEKK